MVRVMPVVVAELEFGNVELEAANDAALEDAPEAFNRAHMYSADHILFVGVMHGLVRVGLADLLIDAVFFSREQADLVGDGFVVKA